MEIKTNKIEFENGTYDLVVCFYNNSDYESYEHGYKSELWFEDGFGNKVRIPSFIMLNSQNIIGYKISSNDDLHTLSDEIIEIIENSGYTRKNYILFTNDAWYIGFSK